LYWRTPIKTALVVAILLLALGLGIAYAASFEISRPIPGGITINLVPLHMSVDINRDGSVDHHDRMAIVGKFHAPSSGETKEDINRDGAVDVLDLALVARYFGKRVEK